MEHSDSKRRVGEPNGRRLTPGERAVHWAKAAVTAWPIILPLLAALGYTNKDHIANLVNGGPPVAEGEVVVPYEIPESLRLSLESFDSAIIRLQEEQRRLNARINAVDRESENDDDEQNIRLGKLEDLVQ